MPEFPGSLCGILPLSPPGAGRGGTPRSRHLVATNCRASSQVRHADQPREGVALRRARSRGRTRAQGWRRAGNRRHPASQVSAGLSQAEGTAGPRPSRSLFLLQKVPPSPLRTPPLVASSLGAGGWGTRLQSRSQQGLGTSAHPFDVAMLGCTQAIWPSLADVLRREQRPRRAPQRTASGHPQIRQAPQLTVRDPLPP